LKITSNALSKGKLWPSADPKPLNRSSLNLNHVITSQTSITKPNLGSIRSGVLLPIYAKYTPSNVFLLHFFPLTLMVALTTLSHYRVSVW